MTDTSNSAREPFARFVDATVGIDGDGVRLKAKGDKVRKHGGLKDGMGGEGTRTAFLDAVDRLPPDDFVSPDAKAQFLQQAKDILGRNNVTTGTVRQVKDLYSETFAPKPAKMNEGERAAVLGYLNNEEEEFGPESQQVYDNFRNDKNDYLKSALEVVDNPNLKESEWAGSCRDGRLRRKKAPELQAMAEFTRHTTEEERYALYRYTGGAYGHINANLRAAKRNAVSTGSQADSELPTTLRTAVALVDRALSHLPKEPLHDGRGDPAMVYRGIGGLEGNVEQFLAAHEVGKIVEYGHPLSTSREENSSFMESADVRLKIRGNGFQKDVQFTTQNPNERELLFPSDQKFRVRSHEELKADGNTVHVYVLDAVDQWGRVPPAAHEPAAAAT